MSWVGKSREMGGLCPYIFPKCLMCLLYPSKIALSVNVYACYGVPQLYMLVMRTEYVVSSLSQSLQGRFIRVGVVICTLECGRSSLEQGSIA
jgi:hypothetical protein